MDSNWNGLGHNVSTTFCVLLTHPLIRRPVHTLAIVFYAISTLSKRTCVCVSAVCTWRHFTIPRTSTFVIRSNFKTSTRNADAFVICQHFSPNQMCHGNLLWRLILYLIVWIIIQSDCCGTYRFNWSEIICFMRRILCTVLWWSVRVSFVSLSLGALYFDILAWSYFRHRIAKPYMHINRNTVVVWHRILFRCVWSICSDLPISCILSPNTTLWFALLRGSWNQSIKNIFVDAVTFIQTWSQWCDSSERSNRSQPRCRRNPFLNWKMRFQSTSCQLNLLLFLVILRARALFLLYRRHDRTLIHWLPELGWHLASLFHCIVYCIEKWACEWARVCVCVCNIASAFAHCHLSCTSTPVWLSSLNCFFAVITSHECCKMHVFVRDKQCSRM